MDVSGEEAYQGAGELVWCPSCAEAVEPLALFCRGCGVRIRAGIARDSRPLVPEEASAHQIGRELEAGERQYGWANMPIGMRLVFGYEVFIAAVATFVLLLSLTMPFLPPLFFVFILAVMALQVALVKGIWFRRGWAYTLVIALKLIAAPWGVARLLGAAASTMGPMGIGEMLSWLLSCFVLVYLLTKKGRSWFSG